MSYFNILLLTAYRHGEILSWENNVQDENDMINIEEAGFHIMNLISLSADCRLFLKNKLLSKKTCTK